MKGLVAFTKCTTKAKGEVSVATDKLLLTIDCVEPLTRAKFTVTSTSTLVAPAKAGEPALDQMVMKITSKVAGEYAGTLTPTCRAPASGVLFEGAKSGELANTKKNGKKLILKGPLPLLGRKKAPVTCS